MFIIRNFPNASRATQNALAGHMRPAYLRPLLVTIVIFRTDPRHVTGLQLCIKIFFKDRLSFLAIQDNQSKHGEPI